MLAESITRSTQDNAKSRSGRTAAGARATNLAAAEILFHQGDRRGPAWRIEEGSLCHFIRWEDGRHEVIEFLFAGDLVGFGHLDRHVSSARALTPARLTRIRTAEFLKALDDDARLAMRVAAAGDREFEVLRVTALASVSHDALPRAAAFLSAVAHLGAAEGRPDGFIPGDALSDWSADAIGVSVNALRSIVDGLARQGVVKPVAGGHQVVDADALDALAAA